MEFGKVPAPELSVIDYALPPDMPVTSASLQKTAHTSQFKVHVGCASWAQKVWKGNLYPPKTKDADFLQEYVKHFNMIELNTTHYRMYDAEAIRKWKEKASGNPDFKFCPKFNQLISHIKRLKGADELTTDFLESMLAFEDKLGPLFLQLNDNFTPKDFPVLKAYLESLPRDLEISLELRHRDWFGVPQNRDVIFELMHKLGIGAIITDTAGRRDVVHMGLPTSSLFLRFVGNALHPTDYVRIESWIERIKEWRKKGLQSVYLGMHQSDELASPVLCDYFIERINKELDLNVPRPFLTPPTQNTLF
ncbi:DUF72 domain-containing protein [Mucilaginibacter terrae]|uniref:Uncharacterized protein YecE (DUF72 family) n=1 Tax=Mucilaginibacter terrae TaxID=1955052 RepID=A0ABU3GSU2_9SPHI|nr:DUF72 domain-containing protein [Mucilaginibacter terrae]MDT3402546.1 uncharacterized protein YecE (DUF72 family) [Mucilaginibacter terrae]